MINHKEINQSISHSPLSRRLFRQTTTVQIQIFFLMLAIICVYTVYLHTRQTTVFLQHASSDSLNNEATPLRTNEHVITSTHNGSIKAVTFDSSVYHHPQYRAPRNIFDCGSSNDLVHDAACVYLDPSGYFNLQHLPGNLLFYVRHYWSSTMGLTHIKRNVSTENLFVHSIQQDIGVYTLLQWNNTEDGDRDTTKTQTYGSRQIPSSWPHTMMGLHIHKCGGTTVGATFNKLARDKNNHYRQTYFYPHAVPFLFQKETESRKEEPISRSTKYWGEGAVNFHKDLLQKVASSHNFTDTSEPYSQASAKHVAFTFVREPIGRFLSSVKEFLVSRNSRKKLCVQSETSKEVVHCLLTHLKQKNGLQLDQHFAPATVSLYMFSLLEPKAKISLIPLNSDNTQRFQNLFFGPNAKNIKLKSSKPKNYNITMDVLDEEMIEQICNLYRVDLYLMQYVGIATPLCDPYISV